MAKSLSPLHWWRHEWYLWWALIGISIEHELEVIALEPKDCVPAVAVEQLVAEEVFVVVHVMSPEVEF